MMTDSRLSIAAASAVLRAFDAFTNRFQAVTGRARTRFEQREWHAAAADAAERLDLYRQALAELVAETQALLGARTEQHQLWIGIKAVYSALIARRDDAGIAETFFNSLTRRIFTTVGVDQQIEFVHPDFEAQQPVQLDFLYTYAYDSRLAQTIEDILARAGFSAAFADRAADARRAAQVIEAQLAEQQFATGGARVELVAAPFFRNKAAYLVGRIIGTDGRALPLVLALLHPEGGIAIDAVLLEERDVAVLFSFTRAPFRVEAARPHDLIWFLKQLMPRKRVAELYIAIGYNKHGKTELYRDLLHEFEQSHEQFTIAPGVRGMVMLVFTLPSYDWVFKIIKDQFDAPKTSTRRDVMDKYDLVFQHDRAGRLIDAQEFEHLQFRRSQCTPELLAALERDAASSTEIDGEMITLRHLYIERRVTPLDLFVRTAPPEQAHAAVEDYGQTIKDLAASNIFPGDMLLKNFGVTRNGRVVFYDYDELCWLTDCVFRDIPPPRNEDEELAAEPWYSVGEHDIFPAELGRFLGLNGPLRAAFLTHHADLHATPFWHAMQARLKAGALADIFPYPPARRLQ
ncbi:MAG: bifunctional isocitrate dehydrogenase kinase/phosphatase [Roseiflexaceae bacterium]|nr:bifunctional isocitrate dehydrogenase kinase/phosphatase [Roseiflexaceae bacterium]